MFGFNKDIGIDLGTANTLVYIKGKGVVIQEPSMVAINRQTNSVLAVGREAKNMVGRTPGGIVAVRPMEDGVIADFDVTERMLGHFIRKATKRFSLFRPRVLVAVPSGVTEVEQRAVIDAVRSAGAKEARLIEEPMAAAIGAGLPVQEPTGSMVVDIGGGTTEVAVISLGGIVTHRSIRIGGDEMDEAIVQYIRRTYNLLVGERTAEEIKHTIGNTYEMPDEEKSMDVRGRDLVTGLPKNVVVSSAEIREALAEPVGAIVDAVRVTLERTPPELAADVMDTGIIMVGGGSLLTGLSKLISEETRMPSHVPEDALCAVAVGTGLALDHYELLDRVGIGRNRLGA